MLSMTGAGWLLLKKPTGGLSVAVIGTDMAKDPKLIPSEERPTEDDIAQASLGGPKGNPDLTPAPLTRREKEQMLPNDEPGHVA
jgi:hypothetical protein